MMNIEIRIVADHPSEVRQALLGMLNSTALTGGVLSAQEAEQIRADGPGPVIDEAPYTPAEQAARTVATQTAATPQRERGKPSPGSTRRTKAEIAEDEAADKADAELKKAGEETGAIVADKHVDQDRGAISDSPEDRQDPNNPDAEQDAADEAAETAAAKEAAGGKLTHDDFRNALGAYVKKFGMDAAQEDGPKLIAKVLGKELNPEKPFKTTDIPEDQLERAVAGANEMLAKNPFGRTPVEGGGMFG